VRLDPDRDRLAELRAHLGPREREREAGFARTADRDRYSAARGHLRELLGSALGSDPADVTLVAGPGGKPALDPAAGAADIRFNLSHSREVGLIALAAGREVGADVEFERDDRDLDRLAARVLPAEELARWRRLAEGERQRAFYSAWTRREAYAKARGEGVGLETAATVLAEAPGGTGRWSVGGDGWEVADLDAPAGYAAAVAAEGSGWRLVAAERA
jgi:4'-phosphopantetheinyl transferase